MIRRPSVVVRFLGIGHLRAVMCWGVIFANLRSPVNPRLSPARLLLHPPSFILHPFMTFAVEIDNVTKTFGPHVAVDDLSLRVPGGSVYGFIGPNGSGKTTTLRMIMHILHPDRGSISVLGKNTFDAANDRIGYLPEERGLY